MDRKYDVITLGEILLRLSTPINGRLAQGDTLMKHLGGAELNIASEIGQLGLKTAMISKIPNNLLAAFIKNQMNASRVSENYLISDTADDSRIGVYYYEYGSYPRKPRVVYYRKHSSINNIDIKDVPETMFYNTRLFHTSGITLGLGGNAQKFAIECIRKFKDQKIFSATHNMVKCLLKHLCLRLSYWYNPGILDLRLSFRKLLNLFDRKIIRLRLFQFLYSKKRMRNIFPDSKDLLDAQTYIQRFPVMFIQYDINTVKILRHNICQGITP